MSTKSKWDDGCMGQIKKGRASGPEQIIAYLRAKGMAEELEAPRRRQGAVDVDQIKKPTFHGHIAPEYPGAGCPGCEPDSDNAVGWMAVIGGTIYSFDSPQAVIAKARKMLNSAFDLGAQSEREKLRMKLGL